MDDRFMNELRRDPDSKFERGLREKLRAQDTPRRMPVVRPMPALAFGFAAALMVVLFTFPSVRVSAQSMLDMFRVRKFAAVEFDESRMEKLQALKDQQGKDLLMVFDTHEKLIEPGEPQVYPTLEAGAAAAGLVPMRPAHLPKGLAPDTVTVGGEAAARLSVSEPKLRALLDALALSDVQVPAGLDGKVLEVHKPKMLVQRFTVPGSQPGRGWRASLVQANSPEVSVPAGMDIERLGEVGLRILGLDASEARRIAQATDWRTTLMIPVPLNASRFNPVTVHGQPGLVITSTGKAEGGRQGERSGTMILWTEQGRVFGLVGNLPADDALAMAESVR